MRVLTIQYVKSMCNLGFFAALQSTQPRYKEETKNFSNARENQFYCIGQCMIVQIKIKILLLPLFLDTPG